MNKLQEINSGRNDSRNNTSNQLASCSYTYMHPAMSEYKVHSSLFAPRLPSFSATSTTPNGIRLFARHDSLDAQRTAQANEWLHFGHLDDDDDDDDEFMTMIIYLP